MINGGVHAPKNGERRIQLWWHPSWVLDAVRLEIRMKSAQFRERQAGELQFWLRGGNIVATLISFQITTAVESQPAGVVSEDTCV